MSLHCTPRRRAARLCAALVVTLLVSVQSASAGPFSEMIVFGDSLSDMGNTYGRTATVAPGTPGYFNGRFSNGPVWAERLNGALGLGQLNRSITGGKDFANGGVTTGGGTTIYNPGAFIEIHAPNIGKQVTDWTTANNANANQLFTMLGGGNDFFAVLDSGAATTPAQVATNIKTNLDNLYNDGARKFLVLNLPDLGKVPRYRATPKEAQATQLATDYNAALKTALDDLDANRANIQIFRVDLFALIAEAIQNPANFNLVNVTDRAYTGDDTFAGNGTANANAGQFLFWDAVHPTARAHEIIGDAAYFAVPEPASVSVLGTVLLVVMRRRQVWR